jgi:hypothetical protein
MSATPKDELPEDVVRDATGREYRMRVSTSGLLELQEVPLPHEGQKPWWTVGGRDEVSMRAGKYPNAGWPRALAYYDEQVGRQKERLTLAEARDVALATMAETEAREQSERTSEADEQPSSVGINTTGECARCGNGHFRLGNFCSRECERWFEGSPQKFLIDLTRALLKVVPFGEWCSEVPATLTSVLREERDTALARGNELEKSLHRFQHGEEIEGDYACESSLRQQKVIDDLRDELKVALARMESAETLAQEFLARAEKAEGDCQAALKAWHREEETVREMRRERNSLQSILDTLLATLSKALPATPISPKNAREALELVVRERDEAKGRAEKAEAKFEAMDKRCAEYINTLTRQRNEAQARARELEEELKEVSERKLFSRRELERHVVEMETELASVTAQRDRAWSARSDYIGHEYPGRPSCIPDGVTEWTRLPSGLACWRDGEKCCIEDARPFNENNPWIVDRENSYEAVYTASKVLSEEFTKAITPEDFTAARRFMGWE